MSDAPFDVFAVMIAIAAFLIALKASNQAANLRRQLSSLEEALRAQRQVQPPPLMPTQEQPAWPATIAAEPPPLAAEAEPAPPLVTDDVSPPPLETSADHIAPPPPVPAAE